MTGAQAASHGTRSAGTSGDGRVGRFPATGGGARRADDQKFTAASVMISIVPRAPNSMEILAIVRLSGASTTLT